MQLKHIALGRDEKLTSSITSLRKETRINQQFTMFIKPIRPFLTSVDKAHVVLGLGAVSSWPFSGTTFEYVWTPNQLMYMLNYVFLDKTAIESIIYNAPRVGQTVGTFIGNDAWTTSLGELLLNVQIEYMYIPLKHWKYVGGSAFFWTKPRLNQLYIMFLVYVRLSEHSLGTTRGLQVSVNYCWMCKSSTSHWNIESMLGEVRFFGQNRYWINYI